MIDKIPYFGKNTYDIIDNIRTKKTSRAIKKYNSMWEFIWIEGLVKNNVIIIDASDETKIAYIADAKFNYRDGETYIPYFDYETVECPLPRKTTVERGHLLLNFSRTAWLLRYNFCEKKLNLQIKTKYLVFNPITNEKYKVYVENWFSDIFDMHILWSYYIVSSWKQEDILLNGYNGGYTYITRQFPGFVNYEHTKRKELELPTFKEHKQQIDYCDVRSYRFEELFGASVNFDRRPYKTRRLQFDAYLYCIIQQKAMPEDEQLAKRYKKLFEQECILSYKPTGIDDPPLIFKSYWFGVGNYEDKRAITKKV